MYCTTCGKELPDGTLVCDECGTRFTADGQKIENDRTEGGAADEQSSEGHRPYMDYKPFSDFSDEDYQRSGGRSSSGPQAGYRPGNGAGGYGYGTQSQTSDSGSYHENGQGPENGRYSYGSGSYEGNGRGAYSYQYGQGYPYGQNGSEDPGPGRTGPAIAGFILGIVSICSCCVPFLTIPLGLLGLILSILGLQSMYRGLAIAGIVLNTISLVLGMMMLLLLIMEGDLSFSYYWNWLD